MTREEAGKKIIVALDVNKVEKAIQLVIALRGLVGGFKIGLEQIFYQYMTIMKGPRETREEIFRKSQHLFELLDNQEFMDVKLNDIPNTTGAASREICSGQPLMFNIHANSGPASIRAAREAVDDTCNRLGIKQKPLLLAVTWLTSLSPEDMGAVGLECEVGEKYPDRLEHVSNLAQLAQEGVCDGVIASPLEIQAIRKDCGSNFLIYTPGVRLPGSEKRDQKNVATPGEAIVWGANGVIVGRDINSAKDPIEAANLVIDNILEATHRNWIETQP